MLEWREMAATSGHGAGVLQVLHSLVDIAEDSLSG